MKPPIVHCKYLCTPISVCNGMYLLLLIVKAHFSWAAKKTLPILSALPPTRQVYPLACTISINQFFDKVLFTDCCRWQNFCPSLLRLVNNCVESIYKI